MAAKRARILFVISGPSGSGKETVITHLLKNVSELERVTTYATRARRPAEAEGRPYRFISEEEFDRLVEEGEIFEQETVYGSYRYGSPRRALDEETGSDLLIELDPNGFRRFRARRPDSTVGIFLLVPDLATLMKRITARHPEADVDARLETARQQIHESSDYDYILMNDDLKRCCQDAELVCAAERVRQRGRTQQRLFDAH